MSFFDITKMKKDTALGVCNALYAIMLSVAVVKIFDEQRLHDWPWVLVGLIIVLALYFVLDWLSFCAMMDIDEKPPHMKVLLYIVSISWIGALLAECPNLAKGTDSIIEIDSKFFIAFQILLLLYVLGTTVGGAHQLRRLYARVGRRLNPDSLSWQQMDTCLRVIALIIHVGFMVGYLLEPVDAGNLHLLPPLVVVLFLGIGKLYRYSELLLPMVRAAQNEERRNRQRKRSFSS